MQKKPYSPAKRYSNHASVTNRKDLHAHLNTVETPFNKLAEKELCPGAGMLEKINAALR